MWKPRGHSTSDSKQSLSEQLVESRAWTNRAAHGCSPIASYYLLFANCSFGLRKTQQPKRIAGNLMKNRFISFGKGLGLGVGAGRSVGCNAFTSQHVFDAKYVVGVAHCQAGVHTIGMHDRAHASR